MTKVLKSINQPILKNLKTYGRMVIKTKNGGYIIYGRSDATLNPGGVRIGTGEIYSALQNFLGLMIVWQLAT